MSELCAVHKIVAAPDGRCVLCRRPKLAFINDEEESVGSKTFTALLGLGLLATMGFAAYTFAVPSANASNTTRVREVATQSANVSTKSPANVVEAEAATPALPNPPIEVSAVTKPKAKAADAVLEEPASSKRKRMRTVGKRIVDPRLIEARKSVRVTMYSAPWCFICDRARSFLEAREVDLVDYNVDLDTDAEKRLGQLNPTGSIPTFIVDGNTIVGFHPWGLEDAIDRVAQENYCVQTDLQSDKGAVCERLASAK